MGMNFKLIKGDDKTLDIQVLDLNNEPVDLTDISSCKWGLFDSGADAAIWDDVSIEKNLTDGIEVITPESGIIRVSITNSETTVLNVGQCYFHNVIIEDGVGSRISVRNSDGYMGTAKVLL